MPTFFFEERRISSLRREWRWIVEVGLANVGKLWVLGAGFASLRAGTCPKGPLPDTDSSTAQRAAQPQPQGYRRSMTYHTAAPRNSRALPALKACTGQNASPADGCSRRAFTCRRANGRQRRGGYFGCSPPRPTHRQPFQNPLPQLREPDKIPRPSSACPTSTLNGEVSHNYGRLRV